MEEILLGKKREREPEEEINCQDRLEKLIDEITSCNPRYKLFCSFCNKDISRKIKVISNDSSKVVCFTCLLEKQEEAVGEQYVIFDSLRYNLFTSDWNAEEELELIKGIKKYGLDNWTDLVANLPSKTKWEAESHFFTFYYNERHNLPLPYLSVMRNNEGEIEYDSVKLTLNNELAQNNYEECRVAQGKLPEITTNQAKGRNSSRQVIRNRNNNQNRENAAELIGYWPRRNEFDIEFLNDAEIEVCDIDFEEDDSENEKGLKLEMIKCYLAQLEEREKRKE